MKYLLLTTLIGLSLNATFAEEVAPGVLRTLDHQEVGPELA